MAKVTGPDFITLPDSPEQQPNARSFSTKPSGLAVRQSPRLALSAHLLGITKGTFLPAAGMLVTAAISLLSVTIVMLWGLRQPSVRPA